jgi:YD repeat-containing protein
VDANQHCTLNTYNYDNELTQVDRYSSGTCTGTPLQTLKTVYDANGNVDQQIDGLNHTMKYTYDTLNHLLSMTYGYGLPAPQPKTTNYTYDAVGNLTQKKDAFASQRTTNYGYDTADELTSISYSDGVTPNVSLPTTAWGAGPA